MKKLFHKAMTVLGSLALVGATLSGALAASYSSLSASNTAVVVGAANVAAASDLAAAGYVTKDLGTDSTSVVDGDSFKLDKNSDHFNFGDKLNSTYDTIGGSKAEFLADGYYDDGDIDSVKYTQKVTLSNKPLEFFSDDDYEDEEPTMGFRWSDGEEVLSYTMSFAKAIPLDDLNKTELPLFGGEYYVTAATATSIEMFDSADTVVLKENEELTVDGKNFKINYVNTGIVQLTVDGVTRTKLKEGDSLKLDDGSYVIINGINYYETLDRPTSVEFSVGSGKIKLTKDGSNIELNGKSQDGIYASYSATATDISSITIEWRSEDDSFLTEEHPLSMPIFGVYQLAFGGLEHSSDAEKISITGGDKLTLDTGYDYSIDLLSFNESAAADYDLGESTKYALVTSTTGNWDHDGADTADVTATNGLLLTTNNRFIATLNSSSDLDDLQTAYYQLTKVSNNSDGDISVVISSKMGDDASYEFTSINEKIEIGDMELELLAINETNKQALINFSSGVAFDKVYSKNGLMITLPSTLTFGETKILLTEAADEKIGTGKVVELTAMNTTDEMYVKLERDANVSVLETGDDEYTAYVKSDLASVISTDESDKPYTFSIEYSGKESTADVSLVSGKVTTSTSGAAAVFDSESEKYAGKNLIVVGGPCVNTVAAELLGGKKCGADFTAATKVGEGQFMIAAYDKAGKTALLVAGYEAADTTKAVDTLLKNAETISLVAGSKNIYSTATGTVTSTN